MLHTAESWFLKECKDQKEHFERTKKARRASNPIESNFVNKAEYENALSKRVRLCDDELHVGERLMPCTLDHFYGVNGLPVGNCKLCKKTRQAKAREVQAAEKAAALIGRFATARDWQEFNTAKYNADPKHRHVAPKEVEFSDREEYLKALQLEAERKTNGSEGRKSKKEYADEQKRKYHERKAQTTAHDPSRSEEQKQESKRRKLDRDNAAKRERMRAPIADNMGRCCVGPHDVPLSEVEFCPVADLGIAYNGPTGKLRRKYCKKHFLNYINNLRRHNNKIERREYNRKGLIKYRTTDKYREYIQRYDVQAKRRISSMRQQAKQRNIGYHLTAEKEDEIVDIDTVCYYCDRRNNPEHRGLYRSSADSIETPLGADRIDSSKDYTDDNVVPCCSQCNFSKGNLSVGDFVKACRNVVCFQDVGVENEYSVEYLRSQEASSFAKYSSTAIEKNIYFEMTPEAYEALRHQPCYACGLEDYSHIGIDRFDSSQGYTAENMRPCCSACNYLKKHYTFDEFVDMCRCVVKVFK